MSPGRFLVLVVDDDRLSIELTQSYLTSHGFDVIAVNSPRAALDFLHSKMVDAVVSDFEMPEMDGLQLAAVIGQTYPTLPFFIMSGRERPSQADQVRLAGWICKGSSGSVLRDELLRRLTKQEENQDKS